MKRDLAFYGAAWVGSGTRGFAEEGYWWHKYAPGLSFEDSTFVAKTITAFRNEGNMRFDPYHYTPLDHFPDCVHVDVLRGHALNSVALSNPGIDDMLLRRRWQRLREPFFISFMTLANAKREYVKETRHFASVLERALPHFDSRRVALQLNVSCPNVGADMSEVTEKAIDQLSILERLDMPIVLKLNVLVSPEEAVEIAAHPACSGLCVSNTIPFGKHLPEEFWRRVFPNGSPLMRRNEKYGGGGLSGKPLLSEVARWVERFREIDGRTHVNAGGGILHHRDVRTLFDAGANSISFASVAMLRPWRVESIISNANYLNELYW